MLFALALAELTEGGMSPERLEDIVDRYGQTILRTAYLYLKDRQKAEDVCQEVFIKLFRENKEFENQSHEKAWILRVTINLCKDQLKSFWFKRIVLDETKQERPGGQGDVVSEAVDAHELYHRVLNLPLPFKTVILLYYYEGFNTREISETLGVPDATVRSRLKRAREKLGADLKGGENDA